MWDSNLTCLSIPQRRIADTISSINFLINRFPNVTGCDLAKATGKIIFMSPVAGNVTSLITRYVFRKKQQNSLGLFFKFSFSRASLTGIAVLGQEFELTQSKTPGV